MKVCRTDRQARQMAQGRIPDRWFTNRSLMNLTQTLIILSAFAGSLAGFSWAQGWSQGVSAEPAPAASSSESGPVSSPANLPDRSPPGALPPLTPQQYKKGQSTPAPTDRQSSDTDWLATPFERLEHEPIEEEPLVEEPLTFEDAAAGYTPKGLVEARTSLSRREQMAGRTQHQRRQPVGRGSAATDGASSDGDSANSEVTAAPLPTAQ